MKISIVAALITFGIGAYAQATSDISVEMDLAVDLPLYDGIPADGSDQACGTTMKIFVDTNEHLCSGSYSQDAESAIMSWKARKCHDLGPAYQNCDVAFECFVLTGYKKCSKEFLERYLQREFQMYCGSRMDNVQAYPKLDGVYPWTHGECLTEVEHDARLTLSEMSGNGRMATSGSIHSHEGEGSSLVAYIDLTSRSN